MQFEPGGPRPGHVERTVVRRDQASWRPTSRPADWKDCSRTHQPARPWRILEARRVHSAARSREDPSRSASAATRSRSRSGRKRRVAHGIRGFQRSGSEYSRAAVACCFETPGSRSPATRRRGPGMMPRSKPDVRYRVGVAVSQFQLGGVREQHQRQFCLRRPRERAVLPLVTKSNPPVTVYGLDLRILPFDVVERERIARSAAPRTLDADFGILRLVRLVGEQRGRFAVVAISRRQGVDAAAAETFRTRSRRPTCARRSSYELLSLNTWLRKPFSLVSSVRPFCIGAGFRAECSAHRQRLLQTLILVLPENP